MASRFYGINKGGMQPSDVVEGASTGSKAVEIQVDLTKTTSVIEVLQMLEALENYIATKEVTPIG